MTDNIRWTKKVRVTFSILVFISLALVAWMISYFARSKRDSAGARPPIHLSLDPKLFREVPVEEARRRAKATNLKEAGLNIPSDSLAVIDNMIKVGSQKKYEEGMALLKTAKTQEDFLRAFRFLQTSADAGNLSAQKQVGLMLDAGLGVKRDD